MLLIRFCALAALLFAGGLLRAQMPQFSSPEEKAQATAPSDEKIRFFGSATAPEQGYVISVGEMESFAWSALESQEEYSSRVSQMVRAWQGQYGFDKVSFDAEKRELTVTMAHLKTAEEVMEQVSALANGKQSTQSKE